MLNALGPRRAPLAISLKRPAWDHENKAYKNTVAEAPHRKDPPVDFFGSCGFTNLGCRAGFLLVQKYQHRTYGGIRLRDVRFPLVASASFRNNRLPLCTRMEGRLASTD